MQSLSLIIWSILNFFNGIEELGKGIILWERRNFLYEIIGIGWAQNCNETLLNCEKSFDIEFPMVLPITDAMVIFPYKHNRDENMQGGLEENERNWKCVELQLLNFPFPFVLLFIG